ncbi:ISAs1 family transposase [Endozoicomonas elysicola]|uniref:H repeat-associated protein N-terminal domain-containing protein n=1 Tax=Endozoicomonas elysicola TaxID=305900 RepID=A0A081KAH3_9GAMM|nr:hypothetical protein GV64_10700 [Endozoicomonas elysicola]
MVSLTTESHHTILLRIVINIIDPKNFQHFFIEWMNVYHKITDDEIVAIDGKYASGSYNKGKNKSAIHMVSTFSAANDALVGSIKTDAKNNEVTETPELLTLLQLKAVFT